MNPLRNTERKSFKNHQQIRRNLGCNFFIPVLLVLIPVYFIILRSPSQFEKNSTRQQQGIKPTQLYLKSYCVRSNCQPSHIDALTSILNLMQLQTPNNLSHPSTPQTQQLYQIQTQSSLSLHIQKQHQLQINSNSLLKPLSYKENPYQKTNGQSRLIQIPLFIIKHHKVTTPIQLTLTQRISSIFNTKDYYESIDAIVSNSNHQILWNPNSKIISIAVRSNAKIHPKLVQIEVVDCQKGINLQLLGLNINISKNVVLVSLGSFPIKQGSNRFNCVDPQCNEGFQSIILKLGSGSIRHIKIFQSFSS